MRLSEAILKGDEILSPNAYSTTFALLRAEGEETCGNVPGCRSADASDAIGKALIGRAGSVEKALDAAYRKIPKGQTEPLGPIGTARAVWPILDTIWDRELPCGCVPGRMSVLQVVQHLTDTERWPAKRIAEMLKETGR